MSLESQIVDLVKKVNEEIRLSDKRASQLFKRIDGLTSGYVPYHVSDAAGLADSPIFIDGTKVGIGVSPGNALHVAGNIQVNSTSQKIHSNIWEVVSSTADMKFRIGSTDAMIIQKVTRNVGIGTTSPAGRLEIKDGGYRKGIVLERGGTAVDRGFIYIGDGTNSTVADEIYIDAINTAIHFRSGAAGVTEGIIFDAAGKVGIGCIPVAKLTVDGDQAYNSATPNFSVDDNVGRKIGIWGSHISRMDHDADDGDLAINFLGYNGGTTRFRDFTVWDGKSALFATFDGSAKTLTVVGCVADGTCEIMKNEDALAIIDDILKTGSGKKDEYNHERMDMKKIHQKYPFMIHEQIGKYGKKTYFDKLGAKSDLIYVAIGQLKEKIKVLEEQLNN